MLSFALFAATIFAASLASNVMDLTPDNFDEVVNGDKFVFVEFFAPWCGHCKQLAPEYEIVGDAFKKHADRVVIAKVDADAKENKDLASKFGVKGYPTLKYFPKGKTDAEDYSSGRTASDIVTFINGKAGTSAIIKTAPSDVTVLDDKNFDSIALHMEKDVLVEFYAPWCGHCKNLAPTYEKVGAAFKSESNCVIAKIDADSQKESGSKYGISGFPTIKFFPRGSTEAEEYNGGRSEQDFIDFMNEKCGTHRESGGLLSAMAGRVAELDDLAQKFVKAAADARDAVRTECETAAGEDKIRQYYHKVMQKVQAKGDEYIKTEFARLARMLEGSLSDEKKDAFTMKQNILRSFGAEETPEAREEL